MTDLNKSELRRLAEGARDDYWSPDVGMTAAETMYACSAAPGVVLALLDELHSTESRLREVDTACATAEYERDRLRDEVEALRKDAERYRWLSHRPRWAGIHTDFGREGFYQRHRVTWYTGDDWPQTEGQSLDEAIDAAITMAHSKCTSTT